MEIRRNYFFKPLKWRVGDPSYAGIPWLVKNSFELKNAQRVLFEGNVLQQNWAHGQSGFMVLFTPRIECTGVAPSCVPQAVVNDVTFRHNRLISSGSGFSMIGRDGDFLSTTWSWPSQTNRVWIHDNILEDFNAANWNSAWGGTGYGIAFAYGVTDLRIDHNTGFQDGALGSIGESPLNTPGVPLIPHTRFIFQDNIFPRGGGWGVSGSGSAEGNSALNYYTPGFTWLKNVIVGAAASSYPANNFYPAGPLPSNINFVNYNNGIGGDYHLLASSPYKNASTDGKDVGADIDMINQMTAGAVTGIWSGNYAPPLPAPDTTPPSLSGGQPSGPLSPGTTQAALGVSTNEAATCKYSTTPGVVYASMPNTFTTTGSYSHSATITGLANGGTYNYYVRCIDTSSNLNQNINDYTISFSVNSITNFGRPSTDVTTGWLGTAVPHWSNLDETVASDTDLIRTGFSAGIETTEVKLTPVLTPSVKTGYTIRVRAMTDGIGNTLTYQLVQGTAVIASVNHSLPQWPAWSSDNFTLTTAQASLITNYSDLRVRLIGNALNARVLVSWVEFEVPSGGSTQITNDTTPPPTGTTAGGSGSGGGGGGTSPSSTTQSLPRTYNFIIITPAAAAIFRDFNSEIGINQIEITVNNDAEDVKINVVKYGIKPEQVSVEKSGEVYQYLQINTTNLENKINKTIVQFRVEKSWASGNSLDKDEIAVYKFNESAGKWNELQTTSSSEDSQHYYYDVEMNSFSYFVISGKSSASEEGTGFDKLKEWVSTLGEGKSMTWLLISIALVIFIVLIIIVLVWRLKERRAAFQRDRF